MTPVEIIAAIFAIGMLLKILMVPFVKPKSLMKFVKLWMGNKVMTSVIFSALAVVLGYYLLMEITIVQIFVSGIFMMMLVALLIAAYPKGYVKLSEEVLKDIKAAWYPMLVWLALAIWVVKELFF